MRAVWIQLLPMLLLLLLVALQLVQLPHFPLEPLLESTCLWLALLLMCRWMVPEIRWCYLVLIEDGSSTGVDGTENIERHSMLGAIDDEVN